MAFSCLINLFIGKFVFVDQDYPEWVAALHMAAGIAVLALVVARFVVRLRSARPAEARSGSKLADVLAKVVHYGLYVMLIVITVVGLTFALQSGRLERAFGGGEAPRGAPQGGFPPPPGFAPGTAPGAPGAGAPGPGFQGRRPPSGIFLLMGLHGLSANILLVLIALHIAAAAVSPVHPQGQPDRPNVVRGPLASRTPHLHESRIPDASASGIYC